MKGSISQCFHLKWHKNNSPHQAELKSTCHACPHKTRSRNLKGLVSEREVADMEKQKNRETEAERESRIREDAKHKEAQQPPNMSPMQAVTCGAYGGGIYGAEGGEAPRKPAASETQSADGPADTAELRPKHAPPPSSGDRDVDITGQSYIQ